AYHLSLHKSSRPALKSISRLPDTLRLRSVSALSPRPPRFKGSFRCIVQAEFGLSACRCLHVYAPALCTLTASPHLLRHIRSLSVIGRSEILQVVLDIGFPLLQKISFNFQDLEGPDDDVFQLTRKCIGLPLIREVEIFNLFKRGGSSPGISSHLASELRLPQFSALTFLEIPLSLQMHGVMSSLTPDNRLERLVLYVGAYIFQDDDRCDDICAIDAFVASLPMQALRQVELLVGRPFQVETAILCFPQLEARGSLVVTNNRYHDPSKLRALDQIE
ncbi:hypothetical protein FB451DRAFT_1277249, partial [Mycena latifolia]